MVRTALLREIERLVGAIDHDDFCRTERGENLYADMPKSAGTNHRDIFARQVLAALCAAEIIVIDRADKSLDLAKECGAHHVVKADGNEVEAVLELTGGRGAEAVIDFVGEGDAIAKGISMTANGGY